MHGLPLISSPKRMLERLGLGAKAGEALEVLIPKQFQAFGEVLQGQKSWWTCAGCWRQVSSGNSR